MAQTPSFLSCLDRMSPHSTSAARTVPQISEIWKLSLIEVPLWGLLKIINIFLLLIDTSLWAIQILQTGIEGTKNYIHALTSSSWLFLPPVLELPQTKQKEINVSALENTILMMLRSSHRSKTPDIVPFSVPVIWARILKDLDWVVPVRGRQSSVSSVMRFLLASAWVGTW